MLEHCEKKEEAGFVEHIVIYESTRSPPEKALSPPEVAHCINKVILIGRSSMQNFTHGTAVTFNLVPSAQQADYFNYRVGFFVGYFFSPRCSSIMSFSHITEKLKGGGVHDSIQHPFAVRACSPG